MPNLKQAIRDVADFPRPGILFRDIAPLLRDHFDATIYALDALLTSDEWDELDAVAGIESRGFILGAAMAIVAAKALFWCANKASYPRRWLMWPMTLNMGRAFWKCKGATAVYCWWTMFWRPAGP